MDRPVRFGSRRRLLSAWRRIASSLSASIITRASALSSLVTASRPRLSVSSSAAWMEATTAGITFSSFLADLHVDDDLRKDLEVGGECVERLAGPRDEIEDNEGGEQAIARGGEMGKEDVARCTSPPRAALCFCIS